RIRLSWSARYDSASRASARAGAAVAGRPAVRVLSPEPCTPITGSAMRIAFNASIVDGVLSGLGVYTVNLLRALARLHDDLRVYTSAPAVCRADPGIVRRGGAGVQPWRGRRGHLQRIAWIQTSLALRLVADRASVLLSPVPEGMLFPLVPQVVVVHDLTPLHFPHAWPR